MKFSLKRLMVVIGFVAILATITVWQVRRAAIGEAWTEIGGGYSINELPMFGWEFVWIGGAAGSWPSRSVDEINLRMLSITSLPACRTLRIDSSILNEVTTTDEMPCKILTRLLQGVEVPRLELIRWDCTAEDYVAILGTAKCQSAILTITNDDKREILRLLRFHNINCRLEIHVPSR